jgi:hypothetical protein
MAAVVVGRGLSLWFVVDINRWQWQQWWLAVAVMVWMVEMAVVIVVAVLVVVSSDRRGCAGCC